jgi:hypothetical protein
MGTCSYANLLQALCLPERYSFALIRSPTFFFDPYHPYSVVMKCHKLVQ